MCFYEERERESSSSRLIRVSRFWFNERERGFYTFNRIQGQMIVDDTGDDQLTACFIIIIVIWEKQSNRLTVTNLHSPPSFEAVVG